ncbi:MAG: glycosyltransferase family 4 protein [Candidatus Eremiobacteraeota bacterium]|nr:glycosyltransferase family 4 protein [Candidatus Eremiobacteraeota bacterium]
MRVALIAQFYPPEPLAAANRLSAMARAFAEGGDDVHVYTAMPSFPDGVIAEGYRDRRHLVESDGRVVVERVWTYAGAATPGSRVLNWLSVAAGIAARIVAVRERYDAIVVSSPPITLAAPALAAAFAHRAPLVVDVRDVFPDVAVKMGAWRADSRLARTVGRVADALYARAALVTSVTEPQCAEIVARGVDPSKVALFSNGFDPIEPAAAPALAPLPGVRDVVYVGNMGLSMALDVVIDAAAVLRDDPTIRFVMVGGGSAAAGLRARVAAEGLRNVVFTGPLPRAEAARALADAAATVVPLVATITDTLPTKLFDAMIAGTPIVLSASGEAKRVVEAAGAGLVVPPEDPAALAAGVRDLLNDPALCARLRANGPPFVRANYDRAAVMRRFAERVRALSAR